MEDETRYTRCWRKNDDTEQVILCLAAAERRINEMGKALLEEVKQSGVLARRKFGQPGGEIFKRSSFALGRELTMRIKHARSARNSSRKDRGRTSSTPSESGAE
ncbi:MAG: hypothetical protein FJ118_02625 [Deltaproteobacteria bacterium]|nr:hypothetical protein [Deltaproteobacteria bacterium]